MFRNIEQINKFVYLLCGVLFSTFIFCYLYYYQSDLLAAIQCIYSKGQTHYNPLVGAILIALILLLLQICISRFYKSNLYYFPALSFFPSAMLLTLMTGCVINDNNTLIHSTSIYVFIVSVLCYSAILIFFVKRNIRITSGFLKCLWINLFIMSVIFLYVCIFSNNSRKFHVRSYVEQCLLKNNYKEALSVIKKSGETDPCLTMLTVYALSCDSILADHLFEFKLSGASSSLLPTSSTLRTLVFPENKLYYHIGVKIHQDIPPINYIEYMLNHGYGKEPTADYLLCGYLMDGNINAFVENIGKYYEINDSLPKHYKEALILYRHLHASPSIIFKNSIMDADFKDYQRLEHEMDNINIRKNKLRDIYGNTYWFYYQYVIS